jgi:hypothetical protein
MVARWKKGSHGHPTLGARTLVGAGVPISARSWRERAVVVLERRTYDEKHSAVNRLDSEPR